MLLTNQKESHGYSKQTSVTRGYGAGRINWMTGTDV